MTKNQTKEAFQNNYMHTHINMARLTAYELGVFTTFESTPSLLFKEPHKYFAHGSIFRSNVILEVVL